MKLIQTLKHHRWCLGLLLFVVLGCTTAALLVYYLLWKPMEEKFNEAQTQAAQAQTQAAQAQTQAAQAQAEAAQAQAQAQAAQAQAAEAAEAKAQAESTPTNSCPEALETLKTINATLGGMLGLPPG